MLPQIGALGEKYHEWVNLPVDRELRLFGPWYLECLTKTLWWLVPLFWIPSISYLVLKEARQNDQVTAIAIELFKNHIIDTLPRRNIHEPSFGISLVAFYCGP